MHLKDPRQSPFAYTPRPCSRTALLWLCATALLAQQPTTIRVPVRLVSVPTLVLGPDGREHFGLGLGSLVITASVVFLGLYTFSCHSFRHLIGGKNDTMTHQPVKMACYGCVSSLNKRHMNFAWISLFGVMSADLYVRLCSMGVISDIRIF